MRHPGNIQEIADIGPDYMGFIFYMESPRFVGTEFTLSSTSPGPEPVGVFVNETAENIMRGLGRIGSTMVQLHGVESPADCKRLKDTGLRVIKAVPVGADFEPKVLAAYVDAVDYFLFDTRGKLFGGNAVKFDWTLLDKYEFDVPFFLSGGIGADDVEAIRGVRHSKLYAIDLNSRVEVAPGLKDPLRVRRAKELMDSL